MDNNRKNFFWPSYVDLFTALFAIVLVLFVLSFNNLNKANGTITKTLDSCKVKVDQAARIEKIDSQIRALVKTELFDYDSKYKRFLVKDFIGKPIFVEKTFTMYGQYKESAKRTGEEIRDLINKFKDDEDISFMVLIESNTAKNFDGNPQGTIDGNYELSYKRSLALLKFWEEVGIRFNDKTEVIIAGSGVKGIGRDPIEENNRRFLIQVIPKIKK